MFCIINVHQFYYNFVAIRATKLMLFKFIVFFIDDCGTSLKDVVPNCNTRYN